jgi:hypothetical protein
MLTIHVWPKRLKEFLLTHPLYKSPKTRLSPSVPVVPSGTLARASLATFARDLIYMKCGHI